MIEAFGTETEDRIRAAAVLPRLPVGLRTRVLVSARQAHRRRMVRRSLLGAAALLVSVAALGAWSSCGWYADCPEPSAQSSEHSPPSAPIMSGIGQWDHVEAEQRKRDEDRQTLFDALFDSQ